MTTLSVIVASSGRDTLPRTIEAARSQMRVGDEILVSVQQDCPWGHRARNQLMKVARGDAMLFIDDDDMHAPGALDVVRARFSEKPGAMHIFKMRYPDGNLLWQTPQLACGFVSTQMVVVPRRRLREEEQAPRWGDVYEGDWVFIEECGRILPALWHEDVIALVRPAT